MSEDTKAVEQQTTTEATQKPEQTISPEMDAENSALKKLSTDELIDIIRETRSEAKNRRLHERSLQEEISAFRQQQKEGETKSLEEKQEFQKLYGQLKEDTKDYEDLKQFKTTYLTQCKEKVDALKNGLTKAEMELFDLSSKNMSYDEQMTFIEKLLGNRQTTSIIDKTQSTMRSSDGDDASEKNPHMFGNPAGAQSMVLNTLAKLRKQK